jgi:branched-chain amino acid transport system ATP-binding protein
VSDVSATPATATVTAADNIFDVEHVTLRFGGVTSLNKVTIQQRRGEILAVIGPNGAGKTSLFNCLTGFYRPQEGVINFHAAQRGTVDLVGKPPHRISHMGVARTFQTSRMFNALTTFENVKIGVEAGRRPAPLARCSTCRACAAKSASPTTERSICSSWSA